MPAGIPALIQAANVAWVLSTVTSVIKRLSAFSKPLVTLSKEEDPESIPVMKERAATSPRRATDLLLDPAVFTCRSP